MLFSLKFDLLSFNVDTRALNIVVKTNIIIPLRGLFGLQPEKKEERMPVISSDFQPNVVFKCAKNTTVYVAFIYYPKTIL